MNSSYIRRPPCGTSPPADRVNTQNKKDPGEEVQAALRPLPQKAEGKLSNVKEAQPAASEVATAEPTRWKENDVRSAASFSNSLINASPSPSISSLPAKPVAASIDPRVLCLESDTCRRLDSLSSISLGTLGLRCVPRIISTEVPAMSSVKYGNEGAIGAILLDDMATKTSPCTVVSSADLATNRATILSSLT